MTELDFFAGLAITGTVLGIDHTSDLATVQDVLGDGRLYEQHAPAGSEHTYALSGYGLVEIGWIRHASGDWEATHYGTQNHRLTGRGRLHRRRIVGPVLRRRHGRFRERLDIADLRSAVEARGFTMDSATRWHDPAWSEHWVPGVPLSALVVGSPDEADWGPPGTVVKMLGGAGRKETLKAQQRFGGQRQEFRRYAESLLGVPAARRADWLDDHQPGAGPDRVLWWDFLRLTVGNESHDGPPSWTRLRIALDADAGDRGIDPPGQAAVNLAGWRLSHPRDVAALPTMDELVRRWLATAPALDEGRGLAGGQALSPGDIRLSRRLRDQLHALRDCLPHLESAELARTLAQWLELRPRLLSGAPPTPSAG
ncbi:hypothetical protein [Amycolatopsis suaedae]|uniref:Uncharacterized protein n=1 Tax=Amycolatopsis suaedae TaxID=2510978 RepID=A0A4Q7JCF0_9PSEU|nr:hypothetical protein [Amycolatopsis suaedae]RZQ65590.1 hypothetical protein EWH70_00360 [Amycolatopsis suaedae]